MKDLEFGNRLLQLRIKAGLTQAQLGKKVGISAATVSSWEHSRSTPLLGFVPKLANALCVSADELLSMPAHDKQISKIVVTGGPCAGKTTAMSWIQNAFTKLGYAVLFVDETATQLITGGAAPWLSTSNRDFQWHLIQLQQAKEHTFTEIGKTMKENKVLIVCDRAAMETAPT